MGTGALPSGKVTFLFTDIESSTRLFHELGEAFPAMLERHQALIREAVAAYGGVEVRTEGDAFFVAFSDAAGAVAAAVAAQLALSAEPWLGGRELRVRMGLHTAEAAPTAGDYIAIGVHQAARVEAAGHGGQILLTAATAGEVAGAGGLAGGVEGLGLRSLGSHLLKDFPAPEEVFQVTHPDLPDDFPPLRTLSVLAHNLPIQRTSFVGRERELAEVTALAAERGRLVTVVGVGGAGKTRLAMEAAASLLPGLEDGAWVADLGRFDDPSLVPGAIAAALGVREEQGRDLADTLVDALRPKSLLLVLDTCERVVEGAASVAHRLLSACPGLTVLATSRVPLGVPGEVVWRIPVLPEDDAVRLFLERAVALGWAPGTEGPGEEVGEICRRVDGIPLAVELAAARVTTMSPRQIAARLERGLPAFELEGLIGWSHDFLNPVERAVFRRLSVFAGAFPLEAAEAVAADSLVQSSDVAWLLSSLVDKSLLSADPAAERFDLLDTLRAFAWDRLVEAGEAVEVVAAHAGWFAGQVAEARMLIGGADMAAGVARIGAMVDDVRAVLTRMPEFPGVRGFGARLVTALVPFWVTAGWTGEGVLWGERTLSYRSDLDPADHVALAGAVAQMSSFLGNVTRARPLAEEALALARTLDQEVLLAAPLATLATLAATSGELEKAQGLLFELVGITERRGSPPAQLANLRASLGGVLRGLGRLDEARSVLEAAVRDAEAAVNPYVLGQALNNLGVVLMDLGDLGAAREVMSRSLAVREELGDRAGQVFALCNLGHLLLGEGRPAEAGSVYRRGYALAVEVDDSRGMTYAVRGMAQAAGSVGRLDVAVRLVATGEVWSKEAGIVLTEPEQAELAPLLGDLAAAGLDVDSAEPFADAAAVRDAAAALWPG